MTQGTTDGLETVVKIDEITALSGNTPTTTESMYGWNQKGGVCASSTGNMTGIYDLSGGLWERTASYVGNNHEYLSAYGASLTSQGSTKYAMIYPCDTSIDNSTKEHTNENLLMAMKANYAKNTKIYGDAIRETSTAANGNTSWTNDYSEFVGLYRPFVSKGGGFWDTTNAGSFYFYRHAGNNTFDLGFRPVVIPI